MGKMRGGLLAKGAVRSATISAVITRADGTVEDMGTIVYWHHNPLRRLAWSLARIFRRQA